MSCNRVQDQPPRPVAMTSFLRRAQSRFHFISNEGITRNQGGSLCECPLCRRFRLVPTKPTTTNRRPFARRKRKRRNDDDSFTLTDEVPTGIDRQIATFVCHCFLIIMMNAMSMIVRKQLFFSPISTGLSKEWHRNHILLLSRDHGRTGPWGAMARVRQ